MIDQHSRRRRRSGWGRSSVRGTAALHNCARNLTRTPWRSCKNGRGHPRRGSAPAVQPLPELGFGRRRRRLVLPHRGHRKQDSPASPV